MKKMLISLLLAAPCAGAFAEDPLVDYTVVDAVEIPEPLTVWSGDPEAGAAVFEAAGCAACHRAPGHEDAARIGPDLRGVGARLSPGEMRLTIVEPRIAAPETDMPAYYAVGVYGEAPDELVGRTRLSAREIEQLVAWLAALDGESARTPNSPTDRSIVGGE